MTNNTKGEGNYVAARQYDDATKKFVESGKVDQAARDAEPTSEAEAEELERAEREGKARTKEEDPAIRRDEPGDIAPSS